MSSWVTEFLEELEKNTTKEFTENYVYQLWEGREFKIQVVLTLNINNEVLKVTANGIEIYHTWS